MKIFSLVASAVLASTAIGAEPSLRQDSNLQRSVSLPAGRPLVEGAFSKTAIRQVMFIHRDEIKACYESRLKAKPGIAGKVVAQFVIEATGSVSHVKISGSTLNDSSVENCMVNHLSHWRFPRPARGRVAVTYPWVLARAG